MRLRISLQETGTKFSLGFDEKRCFTLGFHESFAKSANAQYAGSYEVIPKISEQYLSTQDRWLSRDLVVRAIPYYEVGNNERGTTAIIGG